MYFVHSSPHHSLSKCVRLQSGSPSNVSGDSYTVESLPAAILSSVVLPAVRCSCSCWLFTRSSIIATKGNMTETKASSCCVSYFTLASSRQTISHSWKIQFFPITGVQTRYLLKDPSRPALLLDSDLHLNLSVCRLPPRRWGCVVFRRDKDCENIMTHYDCGWGGKYKLKPLASWRLIPNLYLLWLRLPACYFNR